MTKTGNFDAFFREKCLTENTAVYRETADFAARQNMTRWRRFLKWGAAAVLMAFLINWFPVYHVAQVWFPSYYTTGEISKLVFRGSPQDLLLASEAMEEAEHACGELGLTRAEAEEKYGPLARFCHNKDSYPDVVDAAGEVTTGSWRIPALWYLQPDEEGNWKAMHIKEHA